MIKIQEEPGMKMFAFLYARSSRSSTRLCWKLVTRKRVLLTRYFMAKLKHRIFFAMLRRPTGPCMTGKRGLQLAMLVTSKHPLLDLEILPTLPQTLPMLLLLKPK
jgi:hypothetical protein